MAQALPSLASAAFRDARVTDVLETEAAINRDQRLGGSKERSFGH